MVSSHIQEFLLNALIEQTRRTAKYERQIKSEDADKLNLLISTHYKVLAGIESNIPCSKLLACQDFLDTLDRPISCEGKNVGEKLERQKKHTGKLLRSLSSMGWQPTTYDLETMEISRNK